MTLERAKTVTIYILFAVAVLLWICRGCEKPIKPVESLNLKPEIKTKDSLIKVVDSLDNRSKTLLVNAVKSDSLADHYKDRYYFYKAKYLSKKDSTPCGTEVKFITQSCDSLIYQDSLRNLAWKQLHINDSTENSSLKKLRGTDSTIIGKQSERIVSDSTKIIKIEKKLRNQKVFTKIAFGAGAVIGVFGGSKLH